ncbi:hypothetical protein [Amorphus sp. 3PC139-8]|uniref:hypothetical protein n=1 Tax=Amorphus sp. 3PC139-8 TaxID=2735676 RepID=UPI00345C89CA
MSTWLSPMRGAAAALLLSLCAVAPAGAAETASQQATDTADAINYVDVFGDAEVETFKAQVVTTNKMENQVVVKTPNRDEYAMPVPPGFDLDEVRENQFLTVSHLQGLILDVAQSKAEEPGITLDLDVTLADPDKLPEGLTVRNVTLTAKILEISQESGTVTFEAPDGEKRTVALVHPELLKKLDIKSGDLVDLHYYDALGVEISNT